MKLLNFSHLRLQKLWNSLYQVPRVLKLGSIKKQGPLKPKTHPLNLPPKTPNPQKPIP